jgi:hypothetical protein
LPLPIIIIASAICLVASAKAHNSQSDWTTPVVLSTNPQAVDPHLTTDSYGSVHAVWSGISNPAPRSTADTIYYARWTDAGWTNPIDIFYNPRSDEARYPVIAATAGTLHLAWSGRLGNVYFSSASLCSPEDVRSWAHPTLLIDDSLNSSRVELISTPEGTLHLVYARQGENSSTIVYMRSEDDGNSWSHPIAVSQNRNGVLDWLPRVVVDGTGVIHVVWSIVQAPEGIPALGVSYARSIDNGASWSVPVELAGLGYGRANLVSVSANELHIVWSGTVGFAGRYHRWSHDGGTTWTDVEQLPNVVQSFGNGFPEMVVDKRGTIHLVTGVEYMSYLARTQQGWIPAEKIWEVDYSYGNPMIEGGMPRIELTDGNRLIAVWHDNWRIFFTTRPVDAEPIAGLDSIACGALATPALPSGAEAISLEPTLQTLPVIERVPDGGGSSVNPVVLNLLVVGALMALVVSVKIGRNRRN